MILKHIIDLFQLISNKIICLEQRMSAELKKMKILSPSSIPVIDKKRTMGLSFFHMIITKSHNSENLFLQLYLEYLEL